MAELVNHPRTGKLTKVAWVENDGVTGRRSSRSKQLKTKKQAKIFKMLVEENDEQYPRHSVLQDHGLVEFGYPINPEYVLGIQAIVLRTDLTDERKIQMLANALSIL